MIRTCIITGLILSLFVLVGCAGKATRENDVINKAARIHADVITIDTHVDIAGPHYATEVLDPGIDHPNLRCDLVKMEKGGLDGVFLAVFTSQRPEFDEKSYNRIYEEAQQKFAAIHRLTSNYPDRCSLARSVADFLKITAERKKAIMIGIENGYIVGDKLEWIRHYHDLGARYITLCHTRHNQICDSSSPDSMLHNGVTEFGKTVIKEMNRLGLMCDASHASEKSFYDLIESSEAPILVSHSGCTAIRDHNRNLTDDQLRALAENGGVVQTVALGWYLAEESEEHSQAMANLWQELGLPPRSELWNMSREERKVWEPVLDSYRQQRKEIEKTIPGQTLNDFVNHIDHAVKIAGIDHVGIGTDFDGGGGIAGFATHAEAPNVTLELVRRGYSKEEIAKIWGENLLRVWREVEETAERLN